MDHIAALERELKAAQKKIRRTGETYSATIQRLEKETANSVHVVIAKNDEIDRLAGEHEITIQGWREAFDLSKEACLASANMSGELRQENERLREALEFYANYDIYGTEMRRAGGILVDGGDTAREALAASKEER